MNIAFKFFSKNKSLLLYGFILAILVFILKWLEWKLLMVNHSMDIYIGVIALFFTALGVWITTQLSKPKTETLIVEKEIFIPIPDEEGINTLALEKLRLSTREYEVLQLVCKGKSNAEIAEELFLSISTIKTHVSNLFVKMDVKSRAQVIEKAKRLKITL